ncbi:TetR/AcrR family transcriptional regulator [Pseudonocardia lacus]|jgi:AcrR family transcriptional regulator|uniref:TetR/AcrR family transcriptional regulator n=1 Tax=Pseudonocardia lacus TaxID=2835865 RepID=UPI001BDC2469|nr:TetR/AcrR family transcriptional regulator [Pseudonocardia lacus]
MTQRPAASTGRRPRDSAATRHALLTAARELFAQHGYDATTVRAVADRAGVNQALLFRYFGNKRGLFANAVQGEARELLEGPAENLLERSLDAMLTAEGERYGTETLLAVLRAATSEQVGAEVREQLAAAYSAAFAARATTDDPHDAAVRGELLLAWLLGLSLTRSVLVGGPLSDAEAVRAHVLRAARALLEG